VGGKRSNQVSNYRLSGASGLFTLYHLFYCILQFLVLHIFTILQDIIFLSNYQPRADDTIERDGVSCK
jgi:hypothetical protein